MKPSSLSSPRSAIALLWIATLLVGCSQPLKPNPVVIQCPPPLVDSQLLIPPEHRAIDHLLETLQLPPLNLVNASSNSQPSKPK